MHLSVVDNDFTHEDAKKSLSSDPFHFRALTKHSLCVLLW